MLEEVYLLVRDPLDQTHVLLVDLSLFVEGVRSPTDVELLM